MAAAMVHGTRGPGSLQGSLKVTSPSAQRILDAKSLHQLYNDILQPLTLFPDRAKHAGRPQKALTDWQKLPAIGKAKEEVSDGICQDEVYTDVVAPFMKDARTISSEVLCDVIRRWLHRRLPPNLGSNHVKQTFEEIIVSEVKVASEHIADVLSTSLLVESEKRYLHRRLLGHLMVVSEQLFLHAIHTLEHRKSHSLFSEEANLTRCKAQLLLDCSKFFNVFSASHYLISEIKELKGKEMLLMKPVEMSAEHIMQYFQQIDKKSAAQNFSAQHFSMEYFIKLGRPNIAVQQLQRDTHLTQIKNIKGLDLKKAQSLIPKQEDYNQCMTNVQYDPVTTPCSFKHEGDQEMVEDAHSKHTPRIKKSTSFPNLRIGDLLAEELRITPIAFAAECPEIVNTCPTEEVQENPISNDLRRLLQDSTLQTSQQLERQYSDEEIPPLIRALGPGRQNAAKLQKMQALLQDLNKEPEEPKGQQKTDSALHPQPYTVDFQIPNQPLLRRMEARPSDRKFTLMPNIQMYPPVYNEFSSEIEADTVKRLDRNLYVGQELEEVYTELVKNLSTDHLKFDQDIEFEPYATKLDFTACAASSTLTRKSQQRVINKELDSLAAINECESGTQHPEIDKEATRHCNSWLAWWKSTVNTDDYMKYLATQEVDHLKVIYHLYNSDFDEEEQARITLLKKQEEQKRQREKKIADIRAVKQSYKPGMWNINSVMLGGLGSDPPINESEGEISEPLDSLSQGDPACSHADLQRGLSAVWNALYVPEGERLDMAIKYSSEEFRDRLPEAIQMWQNAVKLIKRREKMLAELERFEKDASDPNRFFHKGFSGTSMARMEESKEREKLYKQMADVDHSITKELQVIKKKCNDTVSYKGRPYEDKMKWDKTEMLYWLQQQRNKTLMECHNKA